MKASLNFNHYLENIPKFHTQNKMLLLGKSTKVKAIILLGPTQKTLTPLCWVMSSAENRIRVNEKTLNEEN